MLTAVWKGFKWFFTPNNGEGLRRITRKHGFSVQTKHINSGDVVVVKGQPRSNLEEILTTYQAMARVSVRMGQKEEDTIENAKKHTWFNEGNFGHVHKEHLLQLCGFHKDKLGADGQEYDPRLIQLINLTLNAQGSVYNEEMRRTFQGNKTIN